MGGDHRRPAPVRGEKALKRFANLKAPRKLVCLETYWSDRHVQAFRGRRGEAFARDFLRAIHESVLADFAPARALGHVLHIRGG